MIDPHRHGPWALITGASEGTGAAFARQLAAVGIKPILVARRAEPLAALAAGLPVESVTVTCDLTAPDAAEQIVAAVGSREVGLLITNAGTDWNTGYFLDGTMAHYRALIGLNVLTTTELAHHYGTAMAARGRGGIILVNSGAAYGGLVGVGVYSAAKAYVLNMAEALWGELGEFGVDVVTLVMGQTDTPSHRRLMAAKGHPIPPDQADPEDVARLGLAELGNGPVVNWPGIAALAPTSAEARRERVIRIAEMSRGYAGDGASHG